MGQIQSVACLQLKFDWNRIRLICLRIVYDYFQGIMTKTEWPTKSKNFGSWLFTERHCSK
jgi:hypothetical protein